MALITCSECGKEISNKAAVCIHCGAPINNNSVIDNDRYMITMNMNEKPNKSRYFEFRDLLKYVFHIQDKDLIFKIHDEKVPLVSNLTLTEAKKIANIFEEKHIIVNIIKDDHTNTDMDNHIDIKFNNVPYCPKCGSTHIEATQRGYSGFWGFLGSGITMNYCKNCGHKWNP